MPRFCRAALYPYARESYGFYDVCTCIYAPCKPQAQGAEIYTVMARAHNTLADDDIHALIVMVRVAARWSGGRDRR